MMIKFFALVLLLFALAGCAHSTIIPFNLPPGGQIKKFPATDPKDVGIYRSTRPFSPFIELGMISYRADFLNLPVLYDQIRKDSAECGAQAVVDVKITEETHSEYEPKEICHPETVCNADGTCNTENKCHTEQVLTEKSTVLITGSMIRGTP